MPNLTGTATTAMPNLNDPNRPAVPNSSAAQQREGVQKFADSFHELFEDVAAKRDELASARS